jgi:hypothetical protein
LRELFQAILHVRRYDQARQFIFFWPNTLCRDSHFEVDAVRGLTGAWMGTMNERKEQVKQKGWVKAWQGGYSLTFEMLLVLLQQVTADVAILEHLFQLRSERCPAVLHTSRSSRIKKQDKNSWKK